MSSASSPVRMARNSDTHVSVDWNMQGISCPSKAFSLKAFSFKGRADAGRASPNPFRASLTMSFVSLCLSLVGLTFSATGMSAVPVEERSSASGTSPRPQLRPTPVEISSGDRDDAAPGPGRLAPVANQQFPSDSAILRRNSRLGRRLAPCSDLIFV